MKDLNKKTSLRELAGPARSVVFFVLFFLYLWLIVDLRIILYCGGVVKNIPVFYLGWDFLSNHLSYPGGPVEYMTALMAQLWHIGWLGALIVTITAWFLFLCADTITRLIKAPYIRFVRFVLPILLLAIFAKYTYYFDTAVSLLVALSFVVLYLKISGRQKRFGHIVFLALSAVLYYLGGKSFSLFAVICGIYELFFNRRVKTALLYLLLAAAVPYAVEGIILRMGAIDTYVRHLPIPPFPNPMQGVAWLLYCLVPLGMFGSGLLKTVGLLHPGLRLLATLPAAVVRPQIVKTIALFAIAALPLFFTNDHNIGTLKADYYASRKNWHKVMRTARSYPTSRFTLHLVNRALYHTGRLPYDLFSFPQDSSILYLTTKEGDPDDSGFARGLWHGIETYLDLGSVNRAQFSIWLSLEAYGEQPVLLKDLALINMAKGNYNSASVHLAALSKTLFHAEWANEYIDKLKSDPTLINDAEIQRLRSMMLKKNDGSTSYDDSDPVEISLDLLEANDRNRMAFEYMMAYYLLERKEGLVLFLQNLDRLIDFNYTKLPRLYEEAILVYMYETQKTVDLHGFQISSESVQRNENFAKSIQTHGGLTTAREYMAENFGDSYLFYYLYGKSGAKK